MTGHITPDDPLFSPYQFGAFALSHRIVMPALTRMRAGRKDAVPSPLAPSYYSQRATEGGLVIAEATQVSQQGQGYPQTPGIFTPEQVEGWRAVTTAVKAKGATILLQLWHVGRISHSSHQKDGALPVAPSAVQPGGMALTSRWESVEHETPRALELEEIRQIVADYRRGAENAKAAGFDGVEIHSANGYLLDQFLQDKTNQRTDEYGGPIENRSRLLLEVVDAVAEVWPLDRIGVRLSPFSDVGDIADSDPHSLFSAVIRQLSDRGIAYLHLIEPRVRAGFVEKLNEGAPQSVATLFRPDFVGTLITSGGHTGETARVALSSGISDLVAFGRTFISNPDLPVRLRMGAELNAYNRRTFYGGAEQGYTDYPTLEQAADLAAQPPEPSA